MRQLPVHRVQKVWGRQDPPAPFVNLADQPLGEIWFDPPPEVPNLLVKYIFTSAALSVQVHPDDAQAPVGHRGKNECWYILEAEPGAKIAVGLNREMSVEDLRAAALDGSIENDLGYFEVQAGDFFFIPAGTVHAIGAGISLLEVQQNSDVTYRLYDYGRPRDLHLEEGLEVAYRGPYTLAPQESAVLPGYVELIDGPNFRVGRMTGGGSPPADRFTSQTLILPLSKGASIRGAPLGIGSCILVDSIEGLALEARASVALVEDTTKLTI